MSIKSQKFEAGIEQLYQIWQTLPHAPDTCKWKNVDVRESFGQIYLTIIVEVDQQCRRSEPTISDDHDDLNEIHEGEEVIDEIDDESIQLTGSEATLQQSARSVVYDLVYSTSYQVPVLYLTPTMKPSSGGLSPVDEFHQSLVPSHKRRQIQEVGVLGALSMTDHPVTGLPACFVHPCRTQEAMLAVLGEQEVPAMEYLMLWFGFIGSSVGLDVPVDLAVKVRNAI